MKAMLSTYLPKVEAARWIPYIHTRGWSKKVLIFGPSDALIHPVIPLALLKAEYSRLPRVWLLQDTRDPLGEKMFIRAKSVLFGNISNGEYQAQVKSSHIGRGMWIHGRTAAIDGPAKIR